MTLTLKALHEGLLECDVALVVLSTKLGALKFKLRHLLRTTLGVVEDTTSPAVTGIPLQPQLGLSLLKLPEDALVHVFDYLVIKDISRLDIAVPEADIRPISIPSSALVNSATNYRILI